MKIVMYGDSITDAGRSWENDFDIAGYGNGYVSMVVKKLLLKEKSDYQIYNRGVCGNRIVDLYARVKADVWNLEPDVLSVLVGVNDVWHEILTRNGVDLERFERIYRMLLDDTKKRFPNVKIILMEPFVLKCSVVEESYEHFLALREYQKVIKEIANDYDCIFIPLQEMLENAAEKYGADEILSDGVHPTDRGANLIAEEWIKIFQAKIDK